MPVNFSFRVQKTRKKTTKKGFEKSHFFVKNYYFHENDQNFAQFGTNLDFLHFGIILFIAPPHISVIFSIIAMLLVDLWTKKCKMAYFHPPPQFSYKSKKRPKLNTAYLANQRLLRNDKVFLKKW